MTDPDIMWAICGTLYGLVYGAVTCRNLDWSLLPDWRDRTARRIERFADRHDIPGDPLPPGFTPPCPDCKYVDIRPIYREDRPGIAGWEYSRFRACNAHRPQPTRPSPARPPELRF